MIKEMRVFHFCTKEFYNVLQERKEIIADDRDFDISEPAGYVKNYVFKVMKLNNGNGMFFTWSNPEYKGTIEYNSNGDYVLLELEVDENIAIKTHYQNWCSCGMDIYDCDGDLEETDLYCRNELGMKDGLKQSYEAIFDTSDCSDEIQILLPYIKSEWIVSAKACKHKLV